MILKDILIEKFNSGEFEYKGAKRIFELLGVKSNSEKDIIRKELDELENSGKIVYVNGKYVLFEHSGLIKGTLKGNERGFAFLICDDKDKGDFFIPPKSLNGALNGDKVIIKHVKGTRGSSDEGVVVRVLERGVKKLVGTFEGENGFGFVVPDDRSNFVDVFVPFKFNFGAKTGDKVVVEIFAYPEGRKNPEGRVVEILGKKFDFKTERLSIIKNADLPLEFPLKVTRAAEAVPDSVRPQDKIGRRDLTQELTVTIDGDDSRDFDDAVSVTENGDGTFTLGVHIADVSAYVLKGDEIDKEALNRSTSVYFPEEVLPMLPFKLSNGICSLNEGVERLTLSCVMKIDGGGNIIDRDIFTSVIKSKKRLTYNIVQKMLDGDKEAIKENSAVYPMILSAHKLMRVLYEKRKKRGTIDLTVQESHITVDKNGNIEIEPRKAVTAYKIIEEFMIAANETVAEYVYYMRYPFVYRVHEKPDGEKLAGFIAFLNALGISVKWSDETCHPKDFATLLDKIKDEPYYQVVNKIMLRTMQKAKYSPKNVGHFGLASACYCHFTSPIRRYPDLVVHRVVKNILSGNPVWQDEYEDYVQEVSITASANERRADEVERDMDDLYVCRYMKKRIGEEYDGVISGVTNFGVFVELENTVEGLIRLENLPKGYYTLDENTFTLTSGAHKYTIGDAVKIKVAGVNSAQKRVEFLLIG